MTRYFSVTAQLESVVFTWLRRWRAAVERRRVEQRDRRRLAALRDRELKDIGLTRDDVDEALSKPHDWRDL